MVKLIGKGVVALLALLVQSGCAHYYLPMSHLESPEVRGTGTIGRLEPLALVQGTDLLASPTLSYPSPPSTDAPTPQMQKVIALAFGFMGSISDQLELGVRFLPSAPLTFRFKYQLSGEPEVRANAGNFSLSLGLSPGLLLGNQDGVSTVFFAGDVALLTGYRFNEQHLVSLTPFAGFGNLSGVTVTAGGNVKSVSQYGIAAGYQFTEDALLLRAEVTYGNGSMGTSQLGGLYFGLLGGVRL